VGGIASWLWWKRQSSKNPKDKKILFLSSFLNFSALWLVFSGWFLDDDQLGRMVADCCHPSISPV
jgi:hypothetical protein